jgi:hypothetical protein
MKLIFKRIRFFKTKNPNKQANRRRFPAEGIASVWNSTRRMEKEAEEADGEREKKKAKGFGLRTSGLRRRRQRGFPSGRKPAAGYRRGQRDTV